MSATASDSATCFQFEKKEPSVHTVSLTHAAPGFWSLVCTQAFMASLSVFLHPVKSVTFCLMRELGEFRHGADCLAIARARFRNSKRHHYLSKVTGRTMSSALTHTRTQSGNVRGFLKGKVLAD